MGQLNRCVHAALWVVGIALSITFPLTAHTDQHERADKEVLSSVSEEYADADASDCMDCHDEESVYPVLSILATPHAVKADSRTPLAQQHECQTCHGASAAHLEDEGTPPPITFGPDQPAGPQNETCLGCHQGGDRMNWQGSTHEGEGVSCAGCHTIHSKEDPVLMKNIRPEIFRREGQTQVCSTCHQEQRAMMYRAFSHPLQEGKMNCSDCHNPHGSMGPTLLTKPTLNETCYECHAEKRGPFLWEHPPAREDCSICHTPHGSNHPALLKQRGPLLCQQCHMAASHPSAAYSGPDLDAPSGPDFHLVSRNCLNCHSEVHGSNHPSGVRFTR
jgi:DmsE family decaheme c-type cytochrome